MNRTTASKKFNDRGDKAEKKVCKALEELKKSGFIENFGWTKPFSRDDLDGIDFIVFPKKGKEIPLQVKSSYREELEKKYTQRGIHCIIVKPHQRIEEVKESILEILKEVLKRETKNGY